MIAVGVGILQEPIAKKRFHAGPWELAQGDQWGLVEALPRLGRHIDPAHGEVDQKNDEVGREGTRERVHESADPLFDGADCSLRFWDCFVRAFGVEHDALVTQPVREGDEAALGVASHDAGHVAACAEIGQNGTEDALEFREGPRAQVLNVAIFEGLGNGEEKGDPFYEKNVHMDDLVSLYGGERRG
jgi:hypothetical protein